MKRLIPTLAVALAGVLWLTPAAQAEFGVKTFDVTFTNEDGSPDTQAGSHPFAMDTYFELNTTAEGLPDGALKDDSFEQLAGFVGDATAMPRCSTADFLALPQVTCAGGTQVGIVAVHAGGGGAWQGEPVYNLAPPPGAPARIGFKVLQVSLVIDVGVKQSSPYSVLGFQHGVPQTLPVFGARLQLWGNPTDPVHNRLRGGPGAGCGEVGISGPPNGDINEVGFAPGTPACPSPSPSKPFLTLPTSCTGPALSSYAVDSWEDPGAFLPATGEPDLTDPAWAAGSALTHNYAEPPLPQGLTGCGKLGFNPTITAKPTSQAATSPTGLDFSLDVKDENLTNPSYEADANSDIRKAVVTLPEGMSINPSIAEGLAVCTPADIKRETLHAAPGEGCPNESKIGSVEVETPLLGEAVKGSLFQAEEDNPATAEPGAENPFDSLIAFYLVIKNPVLGILVKQPIKVEPDPVTGRLHTIADEIPQLPFSHFKLHFREGVHSPLATPPACGTYDAEATLYPYAGGEPVTATSAFQIVSGPNKGACPAGGLPPFKPGLVAGTLNNAAGRFSPFNLRLSRSDGEQEITHFSIKLPPGVVGKLAGIPFCTDAQIAQAKSREYPGGGRLEQASPSCPQASEVGHSLVGAGVGPALTYVPGKVFLAGPYHGSQISIVAITSGIAGPFDLGTVVVREALKINPETAEVFIDATGSDPIPHIIQGIPVHLRDIRAYVDKPEFVLNPTDCTRTSTASTVLGAGLDFVSEADDNPITVTSPFQAADCAALPFKPQLSLSLVGGTKRGSHPAFKAHLAMNGIGEAAIAHAQVTLPHSEFLENAHIKTICTRVQFAAGAGNGANCPPDSVYGHASATTPILSEPLEGPVFLRSSEHKLPDLVAALHNGEINIDLDGHVDSVKGRIRNTFEVVPDAPVSSFDLELQGAGKGLLVNSTDLCKKKNRAIADFTGHNGKVFDTEPVLQAKCPKHKRHKRHHGKRAAR